MIGLKRFWRLLQNASPRSTETPSLSDFGDFLYVVIDRSQVEAMDLAGVRTILDRLLESEDSIRNFFERVEVQVDGYNQDPRELDEIPEVRRFVHALDEFFPYWLFFLTKHGTGLQFILHCFLPTNLSIEDRARLHPPLVNQLLLSRWFPAMNSLCRGVGFSEEDGIALSERVFAYLHQGPIPMPENQTINR